MVPVWKLGVWLMWPGLVAASSCFMGMSWVRPAAKQSPHGPRFSEHMAPQIQTCRWRTGRGYVLIMGVRDGHGSSSRGSQAQRRWAPFQDSSGFLVTAREHQVIVIPDGLRWCS